LALQLSILALILPPIPLLDLAYAQYGEKPGLTTEQLKKCNELDISLDKCTDQNILAKEGHQLPTTEEAQPSFNFVLIIVIVGAVIGISAVVIFFITSRIKKLKVLGS
jgi:hypothetical protein